MELYGRNIYLLLGFVNKSLFFKEIGIFHIVKFALFFIGLFKRL